MNDHHKQLENYLNIALQLYKQEVYYNKFDLFQRYDLGNWLNSADQKECIEQLKTVLLSKSPTKITCGVRSDTGSGLDIRHNE